MTNNPAQQIPSELSYELYQELLEELLSPIERSLDFNVQYELYLSKLVYLENLQQQCFRSINSSSCQSHSFKNEDLITIQDAISSTHAFLRMTILDALEFSLNRPSSRETAI